MTSKQTKLARIIGRAKQTGRIGNSLVLCDLCDNPASMSASLALGWMGCAPGDNLKISFFFWRTVNDMVDCTTCHCEVNRSRHKYGATVTRHYLDAPNRPVARRRALEKLLKGGLMRLMPIDKGKWVKDREFNKAERTAIWAQYFKEHTDLRRNK